MLSLDIARSNLAVRGESELERVYEISNIARSKINKIEGFYAFGCELCGDLGVIDFDVSKLGINVTGLGLTGFEVYDILAKEYNIQMELADLYNVLGIISLGDDIESINSLIYALLDIAAKYAKDAKDYSFPIPLNNPTAGMTPREAFYSQKEFALLDESIGRIIGESVMIYPPGIPILAPGEIISTEAIEYIKILKTQHSQLTDMEDKELNTLLVVKK
jgi:arginine/lysine/ornithine decarboxylase